MPFLDEKLFFAVKIVELSKTKKCPIRCLCAISRTKLVCKNALYPHFEKELKRIRHLEFMVHASQANFIKAINKLSPSIGP